MVTDHSHLHGWTPVAFLADPEPRIVWADLRGQRFDQPFFDHIASKRHVDAGHLATEVTDLSALHALDATPSLDPTLIVAQSARCGSTLLVRLLATMDGVVTVSEPEILSKLFLHGLRNPESAATHDVLREIVRGFGRLRFGDEKIYVLKLSSSMTRFLPQFRRAFPHSPMVWLQRSPIEIVESEMRSPGAWIGFDPQGGGDLAALVLKKTTVTFLAARAHVTDDMLVLDHRDLPDSVWTTLAPWLGLSLSRTDISRMEQCASYDSKSGEPFVRRQRLAMPNAVHDIVRQILNPIHDELGRRRDKRKPLQESGAIG